MRHPNTDLNISKLKRQLNSSFAKGIGSVIAIEGRITIPTNLSGRRPTLVRDANAIAADWKRVGNQIRSASRNVR